MGEVQGFINVCVAITPCVFWLPASHCLGGPEQPCSALIDDLRFVSTAFLPQVKTRLESEQGISFTEFTYQLLQVG